MGENVLRESQREVSASLCGRRFCGIALCVGALALLLACGGAPSSDKTDGTTAVVAQSVVVSATPASVTVGDTVSVRVSYVRGAATVDHGVGTVAAGGVATYVVKAGDVGSLVFAATVVESGRTDVVAKSNAVTVVDTVPPPVVVAPVVATGGRSGYQASIQPPQGTGWTISWAAVNATIDSGQGTYAVTFTPILPSADQVTSPSGNASPSGAAADVVPVTVTLSCVVTTAGGVASPAGTWALTVVPPPKAISLTASTLTPSPGEPVTLTPVFAGGNGTMAPFGAVVSGVGLPVTPTVATDYLLTVTNVAGDVDSASVRITLRPISLSAVQPAGPTVTVGKSLTFTATVTGTSETSVIWSASGGTINAQTGVWTAPTVAGQYTITATAKADPSTRQYTLVTVLDLPRIDYFVVE